MPRIPEHIARALGIPATASLVPLDTIRPTTSDAANGASAGQLATIALAALVNGPIKNSPASFEELPIHDHMLRVGISRLRLWDRAPIFQVVGPAVESTHFVGKTERGAAEIIYLDAREDAGVWVPGDDNHPGVLLRFNTAGSVDCELVSLEGDDLGLSQWVPSGGIEVPAPELVSLTAGLGCPDWLDHEFKAMVVAGTSFEAAAAVGLVGRLWSASSPSANLKATAEIRRAGGPGTRARQWFEQLSPHVRQALDATAKERAHDLLDQLSGLTGVLVKDEGMAHPLALAWLRRRDDLESIAFLSQSSEFRLLLSSVDRAASCENTLWGVLGPFDDDDRLRAVSWQEPESWWGALAFG
jgi:hypothetical protein